MATIGCFSPRFPKNVANNNLYNNIAAFLSKRRYIIFSGGHVAAVYMSAF